MTGARGLGGHIEPPEKTTLKNSSLIRVNYLDSILVQIKCSTMKIFALPKILPFVSRFHSYYDWKITKHIKFGMSLVSGMSLVFGMSLVWYLLQGHSYLKKPAATRKRCGHKVLKGYNVKLRQIFAKIFWKPTSSIFSNDEVSYFLMVQYWELALFVNKEKIIN